MEPPTPHNLAPSANQADSVSPAELVSPPQAHSRAKPGRSPPGRLPVRIRQARLELPSAPTRATLHRFLRGPRQQLSEATSLASAARSTSLLSSSTTRPRIIACSNLSGIRRRILSESGSPVCRPERDWASQWANLLDKILLVRN